MHVISAKYIHRVTVNLRISPACCIRLSCNIFSSQDNAERQVSERQQPGE